MKKPSIAWLYRMICLLGLMGFAFSARAAAPIGNDWFQILANPFTGGDDTGDGGSGLPQDLNYFYVGQSFSGTMQINIDSPSGSNAANIWIDYPNTKVTPSGLGVSTYYSNWAGQVINGGIGRIYSTGFNASGYSSGLGKIGGFTVTADAPTDPNYGTASPAVLNINTGVIGNTTESNISYDGTDILDDAEDFRFHIWADTKKPYAKNPSPSNLAVNVAIDENFQFDLLDSKNGEGDDSGVGTGVNTAEPPGSITTNDGNGDVSVTNDSAFVCSGIWGTNLCNISVDPSSPSGVPGDTRNWNYGTTYTLTISGYQDLASSNQDQLGDTNGPNTMDAKIYTFTTEADTVEPAVSGETPVRASTGNAASTNIVIDVIDLKTYPAGPSGSGVKSSTCRVNISSASVPLVTYDQTSPEVTVMSIAYGYRYAIDPPSDFAEGETVSVSMYDCEDVAGNVMTTDNWTFLVTDLASPYVTDESPSNDQNAGINQNISFHLRDDASGIDLANTVIYVNGVYYSNAGGPGVVTIAGTSITFGSSLNFNGGNYPGDTTSRSGTLKDVVFTIDPENPFTEGEAVPIIIYTRDASGNLMERVIYAFAANGTPSFCPAASSYCGSGTTFNGVKCVSTSSGASCSASNQYSSVPQTLIEINEPTVTVTPLDDQSILITWMTNVPATTLLAFDEKGSVNGEKPYFDYRFSIPENDKFALLHSVKVENLIPGKVYFFKPGGRANGLYGSGQERLMALPYKTLEVPVGIEAPIDPAAPKIICPKPLIVPAPTLPSTRTPSRPRRAPVAPKRPSGATSGASKTQSSVGDDQVGTPASETAADSKSGSGRRRLNLVDVIRQRNGLTFSGTGVPESFVTIVIY